MKKLHLIIAVDRSASMDPCKPDVAELFKYLLQKVMHLDQQGHKITLSAYAFASSAAQLCHGTPHPDMIKEFNVDPDIGRGSAVTANTADILLREAQQLHLQGSDVERAVLLTVTDGAATLDKAEDDARLLCYMSHCKQFNWRFWCATPEGRLSAATIYDPPAVWRGVASELEVPL